MAQQTINAGAFVDDPSAESILSGFTKTNTMTLELFTELALGGRVAIDLSATPDNIREAFIATNTNLAALYTEQSLPSVPVIDVGDALDDPVPTAEMIRAGFTKINAAMTTLYASLEPPPPEGPAVAFPGAEGYGAVTRHAYETATEPVVLHVTNLNDSGTGSLRAALIDTRPRIVVFDTSGTITLSTQITVSSPYLYLAGGTAPNPGILIRNYGLYVTTHNVCIQHIRVRVGDVGTSGNFASIRLDGTNSHHVILDHVSASWGIDETIALSSGALNRHVTISNCLIAEGMHLPPRSPTGENSKCVMIYDNTHYVSLLRNLIMQSVDRHPYLTSNTRVVQINNVAYNWVIASATQIGKFGGSSTPMLTSLVGNVYRRGPSNASTSRCVYCRYIVAGSQVYIADQRNDSSLVAFQGAQSGFDPRVGTSPLPLTGYTILPSSAVEAHVIANAGARPTNRDAVDTRLVTDFTNRTGVSQFTSARLAAVGGFPSLAVNTATYSIPANPHTVTLSGYTNLEVAIHASNAAVEP